MRKLCSVVAALVTTSAFAGDHGVVGAGATSCGKYVALYQAHDASSLLFFTSWTQGYLSGLNVSRSFNDAPDLRYIAPETIQAFTAKFCRDNPLKNIANSAGTLSVELNPTK